MTRDQSVNPYLENKQMIENKAKHICSTYNKSGGKKRRIVQENQIRRETFSAAVRKKELTKRTRVKMVLTQKQPFGT